MSLLWFSAAQIAVFHHCLHETLKARTDPLLIWVSNDAKVMTRIKHVIYLTFCKASPYPSIPRIKQLWVTVTVPFAKSSDAEFVLSQGEPCSMSPLSWWTLKMEVLLIPYQCPKHLPKKWTGKRETEVSLRWVRNRFWALLLRWFCSREKCGTVQMSQCIFLHHTVSEHLENILKENYFATEHAELC